MNEHKRPTKRKPLPGLGKTTFPGGLSTGYKQQVFTPLTGIQVKKGVSLHLNFMTKAISKLLTGALVPRIAPSSSRPGTLPWALG